jgi:hypothetical protein
MKYQNRSQRSVLIGAAGGDRTHDPRLRRPILYPLSYSRNAGQRVRIIVDCERPPGAPPLAAPPRAGALSIIAG